MPLHSTLLLAMAGSQLDSGGMDGLEEGGESSDGRLPKRVRKERSESESQFNVVVRFSGEGGAKHLDPLKLTKIIKNQVGDVRFARVLNDGNLLIGCSSEEQCGKAQKLQSVGKAVVTKVVKLGENGSKGVIYGIPVTVEIKDLIKNLKLRCGAVKDAKRLTRGFEKTESESVLVEFNLKVPPSELYFGFMRYRVREFVQKPMRCFNCQKFGHMAKGCKEAKRCAKCGGEHEYGECGEGTSPKCCNCGGGHSAAYWGCEVMKREVEINNIKVKEKVSYAEALKRVDTLKRAGGENVREIASVTAWKQRQEMLKEKEKKGWEEKRDLVTFIAGVINATAEVKSKTERIQIITKAAIQHLGMVGLKWEEIRDGLSVQASQEGGVG